jgi:hypothetical protein
MKELLNETQELTEEAKEVIINIQQIFKGGVRELNPEKRTEAMKRYFELRIRSHHYIK